jgi:phosphate transport system protein
MVLPPQRDARRSLDAQLEELRERLLLMSGRAEAMITVSVRALVEKNAQLAQETIATDAEINRAEMEVDELCLAILASQVTELAPLRFVSLALKMVTDLERIGDLAVNICERVIDIRGAPHLRPADDIVALGELVRILVHDAFDAFVSGDVEKAQDVIERDDEVDEQYQRVFRDLLSIMQADPAMIEPGIHLQSAAKWLERIGDHATNIAEQVIFMVEGHDVRHLGKLPD